MHPKKGLIMVLIMIIISACIAYIKKIPNTSIRKMYLKYQR